MMTLPVEIRFLIYEQLALDTIIEVPSRAVIILSGAYDGELYNDPWPPVVRTVVLEDTLPLPAVMLSCKQVNLKMKAAKTWTQDLRFKIVPFDLDVSRVVKTKTSAPARITSSSRIRHLHIEWAPILASRWAVNPHPTGSPPPLPMHKDLLEIHSDLGTSTFSHIMTVHVTLRHTLGDISPGAPPAGDVTTRDRLLIAMYIKDLFETCKQTCPALRVVMLTGFFNAELIGDMGQVIEEYDIGARIRRSGLSEEKGVAVWRLVDIRVG